MSQQLFIDVLKGPMAGKCLAIPAGGHLLVGRLPECGLSIPQDLTVSRQHCSIEFAPPACRLVHLSRTGETLVNGAAVTNADLRTGDQVSFGEGNVLRVRVEGAADRSARSDRDTAPTHNDETAPSGILTAASVPCGWTRIESPGQSPGHEPILKALLDSQAVHALFDFRRSGVPAPQRPEPPYLFGWFPPAAQAEVSPWLLSSTDTPELSSLVEQGWGKDGLVCFGSSLAGPELMAHWRKAIGAPDNRPGSALRVYYWPSLVNLALDCQEKDQLSPWLSALDWLFVEAPSAPGGWRLYTSPAARGLLTSAGWRIGEPTAGTK